jgi:hypothetical protein
MELWSTAAYPSATANLVPLRVLLDTLGLGIEQTMLKLGSRPAWTAFTAWAEATAGPADPAAIDRYHAWYEGRETPAKEQARQAALMATPPIFSDAEIDAWDRDGVVVLRQAISSEEAAAIASHLWRLKGASADDPSTWYARHANGIMVPEFQHPTMMVPRRSARLHRAFAQLYGHADLMVSTDRLSFNPPERGDYTFPGPHLHWDTSLAAPIPFETQAILYLTDTPAEQGALQVVPGFHRRLAEGWLESLGGRTPRDVDLSREAVPIAGGAGDLVIWRQELPHGASANAGARPRLAQYVTMYPMSWPDTRHWL